MIILCLNLRYQIPLKIIINNNLLKTLLLMIMGFARFGSVIKFILHPLIVGFTAGIAVIMFSSQMKDFFGLNMGTVPTDFIQKW